MSRFVVVAGFLAAWIISSCTTPKMVRPVEPEPLPVEKVVEMPQHAEPVPVRTEAPAAARTEAPPPYTMPAPAMEVSVREARVTGVSFLIGNKPEKKGYGLYSYLLLTGKPRTEKERKRCMAVIKGLIAMPLAENLEAANIPASSINVTYLPLVTPLPKKWLSPVKMGWEEGYKEFLCKDEVAEWIIENYNYGRAQRLLQLAKLPPTGGPYVVSAPSPLTSCKKDDKILQLDFTRKVVSKICLWIDIFREETGKAEYWKRNKVKRLYTAFLEGVDRVTATIEPIEGTLMKIAKL